MANRPPRLHETQYIGFGAYFVTGRTRLSQPAFARADFCVQCRSQLLRCAEQFRFELTAYCFMPDHVHLLLTGMSEQSMFLPCFHGWRQATGYGWRRISKSRLWQEGYWDHVLRTEDDVLQCAAYIVQNPVRSGLVTRASDYPFLGSARFTMAELEEIAVDAAYRSRSTYKRGRG